MVSNISNIFDLALSFRKSAQQMDSAADRRVQAERAILTSIGVRSGNRDNFDVLSKRINSWFQEQFQEQGMPEKGTWGLKLVATPKNVSVLGVINGKEGSKSKKYFGPLGQKATTQVVSEGLNFEPFEMWLSPEQEY